MELSIGRPSLGNLMFRLLMIASFTLAFLLPASASAFSELRWTPFSVDPETGDYLYGEERAFSNGSVVPVPLDTAGEVYIDTDQVTFSVSGQLYFIPDPDSPTREYVATIGGFFGVGEITWERSGVYELDIYDSDIPTPTNAPLWQRIFAWLVATPAYAEDMFIETIRFTVVEEGVNPSEPDPVIVIPGILGSWEKNGALVIDPVLHTYDDLINTFVLNGFVEGETIFPFPYEWRDSNIFTAGLLRDKINEVQAICACEKVDIVAHSMGGLVARYYIQSGLYENDIDQLIFIATPHIGSPQAYLAWEGGELGFQVRDNVLEFVLEQEARKGGFGDLFQYIQNRPIISIRQLLPTLDYVRDEIVGLRPYPIGYPQNTFLEDLNNNVSVLLDANVRITNVVGNTGAETTISALRVVDSPMPPKWPHGYPEFFNNPLTDRGLDYGSGDDTVLLSSASFIDSGLTEFPANHSAIVKASQAFVYETLVGEAPAQVSDLQQDADFFLLLQVLSPVDVQIVAPDGKRLGKDFETGVELDEIPGGFYSGFATDNEYAVIPNPLDGQYKIFSQGTDNGGAYTLVSGYVSLNELGQQEVTSHILPDDIEELTVTINSQSPEDFTIENTTEVTYGTLYAHIDEAAALGWITDTKFKAVLQKTVQKAEKLSGKGRGFAEKTLLHVLLIELRIGLKKGKINDDGYNLLKEDIEALLRR